MKFNSLIFLCLSFSSLFALENNNKNEDGKVFLAPRLAGDSLAIRNYDKNTTSTEATTLKDAFSQGTVKGLIRYSAQYRDTNLLTIQDGTSKASVKQYSALGGFLGYETAPLFNTSVGATFYTAQKLGNNPDSRRGLGGLNEDGGTTKSYTVLGEAFLKVKDQNNRLVIGRQEMPNYRFVSLSNIRFSPFTHEGASYENTLIDGLQVNLAYITRQKDRNSENFEGMVRAARASKKNSAGKTLVRGSWDTNNFIGNGRYTGESKAMGMLGLVYKQDTYALEAWDYHVSDFVNTVYLYGDYSFKASQDLTLTAALQYGNQQDSGTHVAGNVDTWFYGLKAQASLDSGMTFFTAFNQVAYNENSYDGGTIFVRWGTPQMFNSYQVQDSELAGTSSYGVGAQFELGKLGLVPNTVIRFRHAYYDMPDALTQKDARQDRAESTFDLRYSFTKNDGFGIFTTMQGLSVQFRMAYDKYKTDYDFAAYQLENGYSFKTVTQDFIDTRIYVDYNF